MNVALMAALSGKQKSSWSEPVGFVQPIDKPCEVLYLHFVSTPLEIASFVVLWAGREWWSVILLNTCWIYPPDLIGALVGDGPVLTTALLPAG